MNRILTAMFAGLCAAWALPIAAFERVMTAPPAPSAGQSTTLVFLADTLGDLDLSTGPVASVDGANIRIDLNDECNSIICDFGSDKYFRVEIPALDEGEYLVQLFSRGSSEPRSQSFVFSVGPAVQSTLTRPAEGAWSDPSKPGTGLYLQTRGPLLSVAQFDYVDDRAHWRLDVAPMRGDSAVVLLRNFSNGSCFGCEPFEAPSSGIGGTPLLITFESARRARAQLADGTVVPISSLSFGVDYVPITLADALDDEFGPLPLPDLSGRWAVRGRVVEFRPAQIEDGRVLFPQTAGNDPELSCATHVSLGAGCFVGIGPGNILLAPLPPFGFAALGDIEENRIRVQSFPEPGEDFYMIRIPAAE